MEEKIDKLIEICGNKGRYQYFFLVITFLFWVGINFFQGLLPYLERMPIVSYTDKEGKEHEEVLDYDICEKYPDYKIVEKYGYSWLTIYHFECDKNKVALIGTITFLGTMLGSLLVSVATKYISHKNNLLVSTAGYLIIVICMCIIRNEKLLPLVFTLLLIQGIFCNFVCISSLTVLDEVVANDLRSICGSACNIGYTVCGMGFSCVFWLFKTLNSSYYFSMGISAFCALMVLLFMSNSPRIYILNHDVDGVLKILRHIAKFNGVTDDFEKKLQSEEIQNILDEIKTGHVVENADEENQEALVAPEDGEKKVKKTNKKITAIAVLKYASIRKVFLLMDLIFFNVYYNYNGIALGTKNMPGNFYVNIIVLFAIEAFSYVVDGYMIELKSIGRKGTSIILLVMGIVACIILAFVNMPNAAELVVNSIGRFGFSAMINTLYCYGVELYPTPIRTLGFGINTGFGNIGGAVAPIFLEYLSEKWMNLVYVALSAIDIFCLFFLEETVGKPMKESIKELDEEEEALGEPGEDQALFRKSDANETAEKEEENN